MAYQLVGSALPVVTSAGRAEPKNMEYEEAQFRIWSGAPEKEMYYSDVFNVGEFYSRHGWDIDHQPLMRSIGLKDRKDTPIFEGDIVRAKSNKSKKIVTGTIKWQIWEAAFRLVVRGDYCYRLDEIHTAEVIGNIYENPELPTQR